MAEVGGVSRVSSTRIGQYVVLMLVMVNIVGYVDRQLMTILLESIRHDLKLSAEPTQCPRSDDPCP